MRPGSSTEHGRLINFLPPHHASVSNINPNTPMETHTQAALNQFEADLATGVAVLIPRHFQGVCHRTDTPSARHTISEGHRNFDIAQTPEAARAFDLGPPASPNRLRPPDLQRPPSREITLMKTPACALTLFLLFAVLRIACAQSGGGPGSDVVVAITGSGTLVGEFNYGNGRIDYITNHISANLQFHP